MGQISYALTLALALLSWGCAGGSMAPSGGSAAQATSEGGETLSVSLERHREVEEQNAMLRERMREVEGQLAVARADLRRVRMDSAEPQATRIGECVQPEQSAAPEMVERVVEAEPNSEPRIVLRLYGTPADRGGSRSDTPSAAPARTPLPALDIPARPANVPGELSVTAAPRGNAPPRIAIPVSTTPVAARASRTAASTPESNPENVEPAVRDYRAALALVRDRDLNQGLTRLRRFVQIYGSHAYADNALFWQGEVLFMQRRYQDALRAYSEVLSRYPRGNKVSDAMLKMARCHQRLGNTSQARSLLQRLRREFPQSVAARIASREERS